jgi:phosphoribosylglycinamide formyltransferase, formyltetrahydrofolate-dependent
MMRIAVLASGKGSNFRVIAEHVRAGRIPVDLSLLLCNKPDAPALDIAREFGVPTWSRSHRDFASREAFDAAMLNAMRDAGVEAVVLAGYMRLLSTEFVRTYAGKIINLHPSLLPAFAGTNGGADALAYGVKLTGCTVHFVVDDMDAGAVIIQAALPVAENDTEESLMPRVHALEHRIFPQALAWLAQDRLRQEGRVVRLLPAPGRDTPNRAALAPVPGGCLIHPPLEAGF